MYAVQSEIAYFGGQREETSRILHFFFFCGKNEAVETKEQGIGFFFFFNFYVWGVSVLS